MAAFKAKHPFLQVQALGKWTVIVVIKFREPPQTCQADNVFFLLSFYAPSLLY